MKASDVIGNWLKAKKQVPVLDRPNGNILRIAKPGEYLGEVYSYVVRDGILFWQFKNNIFVKHGEGLFEMQQTRPPEPEISKDVFGEIGKGISDLVSGAGKTLSGVGQSLGLTAKFLPVIIIFVLLFFAYVYAKPLFRQAQ
jgi:hypothetical protein